MNRYAILLYRESVSQISNVVCGQDSHLYIYLCAILFRKIHTYQLRSNVASADTALREISAERTYVYTNVTRLRDLTARARICTTYSDSRKLHTLCV